MIEYDLCVTSYYDKWDIFTRDVIQLYKFQDNDSKSLEENSSTIDLTSETKICCLVETILWGNKGIFTGSIRKNHIRSLETDT